MKSQVDLSTTDLVVRRALNHFRKNLERPLSVPEAARAAFVSRAELARRFHRAFGVPPGAIVRALRLERAAHLLESTEMPLADVGRECGYDSEFSLSRAFRRHHGIAPGRYRSLHRDNETRSAA